jgi:hypothetical protein
VGALLVNGDGTIIRIDGTIATVPLPSSVWLLAAGLTILGLSQYKRREVNSCAEAQ